MSCQQRQRDRLMIDSKCRKTERQITGFREIVSCYGIL
jgi:hypothetical protein